jgi:uncharacterized membrane protein YsdA (DUF1294 family)
LIFGLDKWLAQHNKWRISEQKLLVFSFAGGILGGILGMFIFRHKTQKVSFKLAIGTILILQIIALYFKVIPFEFF